MRKFPLLTLCAILVTGCAKESLQRQQESLESPPTKSRFLSMDSLQKLAVSLPGIFDAEPLTRSGEPRMIAQIVPISDFVGKQITRSSDGTDDARAMENIYIVNYDQNAGFAILSADQQMETVLAYSDQGNITDTMDNPGVHMFLEMLPAYAAQYIDPDIWDSLPDDQKYPAQTEVFDRREYSTVGPYIGQPRWSQWAPLNKTLFEGWPSGIPRPSCPGNPPAGCVAIAILNIMAANSHPASFNNTTLNWAIWKSSQYASGIDEPYQTNLANLVSTIGSAVEMEYSCSGSESNITKADYAFRNWFSYNTDGVYSYHIDRVMQDLNNGRPIYARGFAHETWFSYSNGHAWVIDGYKNVYKVNKIYNNIYDAYHNLIRQEYAGEHRFLDTRWLHNNWGWGGSGNGYYSVGVFNTEYPQELDPDCVRPGEFDHYRFKLEVLKNIRPK